MLMGFRSDLEDKDQNLSETKITIGLALMLVGSPTILFLVTKTEVLSWA